MGNMKPLIYLLVALVISIFSIAYGNTLIKTVDGDCFDRNGNKIQGLTCDVTELTQEGWILFFITLPLYVLLVILAFRSMLIDGVD